MKYVFGTLAAETEGGGVSILELVFAGGIVGYVIIGLSMAALALAVMHAIQIREEALAPADVVAELEAALDRGDVEAAAERCDKGDTFLTRVVGAGLDRYRRSAFGALELRTALEEAGQEQTAKLSRSMDWLGLIAAVAPMLGLLGTVVGMVGAFDTISSSEGFARPDQLAGDISQSLVTTLMGLTLAIPATAVYTFFRNRIDAVTQDIATTVDRLLSRLESHAEYGSKSGEHA